MSLAFCFFLYVARLYKGTKGGGNFGESKRLVEVGSFLSSLQSKSLSVLGEHGSCFFLLPVDENVIISD